MKLKIKTAVLILSREAIIFSGRFLTESTWKNTTALRVILLCACINVLFCKVIFLKYYPGADVDHLACLGVERSTESKFRAIKLRHINIIHVSVIDVDVI